MIHTVIVDDEPLGLEAMRILLGREPDIEIVAEAANVTGAVEAIVTHQPELVLLDIQLADGDGFDVLARVADRHLPMVVFVTAHDHHAVRAFDVFALDYLLKPVDPARMRVALERARQALGATQDPPQYRLAALLEAVDRGGAGVTSEERGFVSRFTVRTRDQYRVVYARDVSYITSAGNYVTLHTRQGQYLVRATLNHLERRLDPAVFARVHRTCIVRLELVQSVLPLGHGAYALVLDDGVRLTVGREYRRRFAGQNSPLPA